MTCYSAGMSRVTRVSVAAALIVAFFALPLAMDQCAVSCEAVRAHLTDTSASSCHHQAAATGFGIGSSPTSCGHDHDSAISSALAGGATRVWVLPSAVIATMLPAAAEREAWWYGHRGSDPPVTVLLTLASHLRI